MTPIDAALPWVLAVVALWAWLSRSTAVLAAIPLLVVVAIATPDAKLRLLLMGVVTAAAFGAAITVNLWRPAPSPARDAAEGGGIHRQSFLLFGLSATFLLRFLPLQTVDWKRELIVLAGVALLLALTKERTPLSLAITLAIALVTPIHPGRMTLYPALVALGQLMVQRLLPWPVAGAVVLLAAAAIARYSLSAIYVLAAAALLAPLAARWSPRATRVVLVFAALLVALWPWSAAVARLLPLPVAGVAVAVVAFLAASGRFATIAGTALLMLVPFAPIVDQQPVMVGAALASSEGVDVDVAPNVREVVLRISGANMPRMRPARVVGQIEAVDRAGRHTTRVLRIGDVADWGFMRRDQFFFSKNVPPRNTTGDIRGFGNDAYLWGAGRIPIRFTAPPASLRVVAANDLPVDARLQVETVEYRVTGDGPLCASALIRSAAAMLPLYVSETRAAARPPHSESALRAEASGASVASRP